MQIKYQMPNIGLYRQSVCVGDLTRYYGFVRFRLLDKIKKIQSNEKYSVKFLNLLRKHSSAGITIDNLISGLETVSELDLFHFDVNGIRQCTSFKGNNLEIEVYMNPMYFASNAAITYALTPDKIPAAIEKEKGSWVNWFEHELNKYYPRDKWIKTITE